jgi:hypothetical protein
MSTREGIEHLGGQLGTHVTLVPHPDRVIGADHVASRLRQRAYLDGTLRGTCRV